MGPKDVIQG